MLIDWFKFCAALVLLLTPISVFHGKNVQYQALTRSWGDYLLQILSLGLHTIDFLRAALGTWLLVDALEARPDAQGILRQGVLLTHAVVLWTAAVLQAVFCKERDAFHVPFTFIGGIVLAYFFPTVGIFALVVAIIVPLGTRIPESYFPTLAIVLPVVSYFLAPSKILASVIVAVAVALPWLITLLFSRHFVISYRGGRSASGAPTRSPFRR